MIIEKILIQNFMCYSDPVELKFSEGINVIIGDNAYGKSKLYDAFHWVMYDQIYGTEEERFLWTREAKGRIISDKAKHHFTDGKITATVSITFRNVDKGDMYILERQYSVTKKNNNLIEDNDGEFSILKKDNPYQQAMVITDETEKARIQNRILPPQLKDYLWFQGEQLESIIDFNDHETLKKAINVLSNITRYDSISNIAIIASKSADNEYDREVRRLSKDANRSEALAKKKNELEDKIILQQSEEKEVRDNLTIAEEKCTLLLNQLQDAERVKDLHSKKQLLVNTLSSFNTSLKDENISFQRKMFRNKWVLKGTESLHEDFAKKFNDYEQNKLQKEAEARVSDQIHQDLIKKLQYRLPKDVPEPIYVARMLEQEKCLVCDREAKANTEPWNKIKELLDRPDLSNKAKQKENNSTDFSADLKRLYQNGLALSHRIPEIDDEINEILDKKIRLSKSIKETEREISDLDVEIQKLLIATSLSSESATNIIAEYTIQNNQARTFSEKLNRISQIIEHDKELLKETEDDLKSLVTGSIPAWLEEKKKILNDFVKLSSSTRERVFAKLIEQLEEEANVHYHAMTKGNKSVRGNIKLSKRHNGNFMPQIIDEQGNHLLGYNTSNLVLVKLATIMAIVSAKTSSNQVDLYTLIADAPTSMFGEDYTIGFCKTISKVYRQSILMSKEFFRNEALKKQLLTNPEIQLGRVYEISPSISAKETERVGRNDLSTIIKPLN